jgi:hypothetical protein
LPPSASAFDETDITQERRSPASGWDAASLT